MDFEYSERTMKLRREVEEFMDAHIFPNEDLYYEQLNEGESRWETPPILEELKAKAKSAGLWNMFLPESERGAGLTNMEYTPLCEIMGKVHFAGEVFNCSAPDTGNMETIERYGTEEHKKQWLEPLLNGEIRSAFAMTEPAVASSDAMNIESRIERDGDEYVLNGRKWWTSGIGDPRCKIIIFMAKNDPKAEPYKQQSMILVPTDTPGIKVHRMLTVMGYDDAPHGHGEVEFKDVRVPVSNMLLGEGRGFEIAQGRLGPGRFQYAMMFVGMAHRCLELMCRRVEEREAFGERLSQKTSIQHDIARSRCEIEQCRMLVLTAADRMDKYGPKEARDYISMVKIIAPKMALDVANRAIQAHGGMGFTQDTPLIHIYMMARTCQVADGPDEVHRQQIARLELRAQQNWTPRGKDVD